MHEHNNSTDIKCITYTSGSMFALMFIDYVIDLTEEGDTITVHITERKLLSNNSFDTIKHISKDWFYNCIHRINFDNWLDRYDNDDICDGHQWVVKIDYLDGSQRIITGSNEYPKDFIILRALLEGDISDEN